MTSTSNRAPTTPRLTVLALTGTLTLLAWASSLGCTNAKNCDVPGINTATTSELTYTEPTAASDARARRLRETDEGTVISNAERARGAARIVGERRVLDQGVSEASDGGVRRIVISSTITTPYASEGVVVNFEVTRLRIAFDEPSGGGARSLADLHATVCEVVEREVDSQSTGDAGSPDAASTVKARTSRGDVCGAVAGRVDFRWSNDAFDADLVFTDAQAEADAPSIQGSAHLHYAPYTDEGTCLDIGSSGR